MPNECDVFKKCFQLASTFPCQNKDQAGTMTDRMDLMIEAAEKQGFEVNQTKTGTWIFRKGGLTVTHRHPQNVQDWFSLIRRLEAAGLVLPE